VGLYLPEPVFSVLSRGALRCPQQGANLIQVTAALVITKINIPLILRRCYAVQVSQAV
jgi:hypothetical protein